MAPNGPGTPAWGDGESCLGGGCCSRRACRRQKLPTARPHQLGGMGSLAQAVVGAQGGHAGGSNSLRPGHTSPGGWGVLPRWWLVLKEGLQGAVGPNGPGTPAWWDGESCLGGGWCSRRACRGQQLPTARAHQPGGVGSPAQAVVAAQGGPAGGSSSLRPGYTGPGGRGVLSRRWLVLKEGMRRAAAPNGPGTPARGDGESCQGCGCCSRRACSLQ